MFEEIEYTFENGETVKTWFEGGWYHVKSLTLDKDGDLVKFHNYYQYDSFAMNRFYQELGKLYYKRIMEGNV